MATATTDPTAHKAQRAALRAKLKNRAGLKANLDRAREELVMAQKLVASHQRTPGYLVAFENAFQFAGREYSDLDNTIPNQLVNSCQDFALKDEFESAMAIRGRLIQEDQDTRQAVKRAEQDLASTRTRITQALGEPAILKDGDSLPWSESFIAKTFSAIQRSLGQVTTPRWAIRDDNQDIAFSPGVHESSVQFHSKQWFDDLKALRMARTAHAKTDRRLAEAEAAKMDIKNRMIWSEI